GGSGDAGSGSGIVKANRWIEKRDLLGRRWTTRLDLWRWLWFGACLTGMVQSELNVDPGSIRARSSAHPSENVNRMAAPVEMASGRFSRTPPASTPRQQDSGNNRNMPTQVLVCLALSLILRHFATLFVYFAKAYSEAVVDGTIAFTIALLTSALTCFLPPPSLTAALADDLDRFVADLVVPLRRLEVSLHHITIALRPGANAPDPSVRVYPAPVAVFALTPLSPLLWLLERLAALPHEPGRFLALVVASSTVVVPLLAPNIFVSLLATYTADGYLRHVVMVLEIVVFLASAALLYLQSSVVLLILPIAADLCREGDPRKRMEMFRQRVNGAPVALELSQLGLALKCRLVSSTALTGFGYLKDRPESDVSSLDRSRGSGTWASAIAEFDIAGTIPFRWSNFPPKSLFDAG
ncbi:uncharacterized protein J3D65DRAFT_689437, partial [Phyllosticta citribraziliensis]